MTPHQPPHVQTAPAPAAVPVSHLEAGALLDLLEKDPAVSYADPAWNGWKVRANRAVDGVLWIDLGSPRLRRKNDLAERVLIAFADGRSRVYEVHPRAGRFREWLGGVDSESIASLRATNPAFAYALSVAEEAQRRYDAARSAT